MPKNKATPVNPPSGPNRQDDREGQPQQPLSGSKSVKNRNHSRSNHGEGS
ncbi:hypothetical protein J31TS4_41930 [Paenibacillus sp. J31TS4]|nr:small acid-soluble spore protein P [Paenibacillus sp. J31TS4]GIP40913.1 hypothetical protein J31TS4_41930 [Paenibacillus sp. J31TS4]